MSARRLQRKLVEGRPHRRDRAAGHPPVAGPPTLARVSEDVAGFGQDLGIGFEAGRPDGVVHRGFAEPVEVLAGEQAAAGGSARGRRDEGVPKQHAFPGDAIEAGRRDKIGAVGPRVGVGLVVGDTDEDVRWPWAAAAGSADESGAGQGRTPEEGAAPHGTSTLTLWRKPLSCASTTATAVIFTMSSTSSPR